MRSPSYEPFLAVTELSDTGKTCEATAKRIDGNRGKSSQMVIQRKGERPPNFLDFSAADDCSAVVPLRKEWPPNARVG